MTTTITEDPRLGLPSASGYHRWRRCFGSHALSKKVPTETLDKSLKDSADVGIRRHELVANEESQVEFEDDYHVERAKFLRSSYLLQNGLEAIQSFTERRFYLKSATDPKIPIASGQVDEVIICRTVDGTEVAVIIDYKMAYGNHGEAINNEQLAMYAVLVSQEFPNVAGIHGVLIQPSLEKDKQCTSTFYDTATVGIYSSEIRSILAMVEQPNAPRYPGRTQCFYCKAKGICPEASALALVGVQELEGVPNLQVIEADVLADYYHKAKQAESIAESLKNLMAYEIKRRLQNGEEVAGFKLTDGKTTRSVTDANAAFAQAHALGIPQEEFIKALKVSITGLEGLHKKYCGLKGKAATEDFEQRFGPIIERKQGEPSLKA